MEESTKVDMKDWELDFKWLQVRHFIKDMLKQTKLPDLNKVLLVIGIQELGQPKARYSKSEKEDLMHIAVCRLMSQEGFYEFKGLDEDGWPHWTVLRPFHYKGLKKQENWLKQNIVHYFNSNGYLDPSEEE